MTQALNLAELIEYTDWERSKWHEWFKNQGDGALAISAGPHGDGRFSTVGDQIKHIFSAETRYVDRLSNRPLTDTAALVSSNVDALFQFGQQSRAHLKEFVATFPGTEWDVFQEFNLLNNYLRATPRKLVLHVLLHEIRHWAQIGTLFRLNGLPVELHDFLFSPVLGGEFKRLAS